MPGRPVAPRANLIAASTVSAPELAKNTLSRYGTYFSRRSASTPASVETSSCTRLGRSLSRTLLSALRTEEILPLTLLEADVIANRFEDANELLVQMARMHGAALPLPVHKHLRNV